MRFLKRYMHDIRIAVESILANKLRSVLTALGIIFGVGAVISMMAIGNGAQQEILEQIKMVGVNNIIIVPVLPEEDEDSNEDASSAADAGQKKKFSKGLTMADAEAIGALVSSVKVMSPEISMNSFVIQHGIREQAKLVGISKEFFQLYDLPLEGGTIFDSHQEESGLAVCLIGANIRSRFFNQSEPLGAYIKVGDVWLKIIGVLERSNITITGHQQSGVNVINDNVFIPAKTMLLRFKNRALTQPNTGSTMRRGRQIIMTSTTTTDTKKNYHQLDRIVVQVKETEQITPTVELLSRMILRRHSGVMDFEITVPEMLLKQQQRTKEIFNIVLGAIASISLLVGGIGIMNIMFASVMERIKEIGTRMAIGAKKKDIVVQFLSEAVLISVTGGLIGVILGVIASWLITKFSGILTIMSLGSVLVSFLVSATVGIIFGYSPAKRASEKDPIESLRYE
ncbi:MAG: ABC transporter permease [Bacteroidales bacterium]|jgi:putative ABC transport system permease protein|nr:ABC transporter permease [Bacteroidales bacterium]